MNSTTDRLAIRARSLTKRFTDSAALDGFSLDVWEGGILSLLGPSGCGKTTALRVIAGLDRPDSGTVEIRGRQVVAPGVHVPPEHRAVGIVFQDYALFPHMTVVENVGYGIGGARDRIRETLELVGLGGLEDRRPHELSGGQQQRVALARALAPRPDVILLDEPFSNLDAELRRRVRTELRSILVESSTTAVFVTHDQEEALSMSDMVAVMHEGRILQAAPPDQLYRSPVDAWTAGFLGDADFLEGTAVDGRVLTIFGPFASEIDGPVRVMVRPESVRLVPGGEGARVIERRFFGHDQLVTVIAGDGTTLRARLGPAADFVAGASVGVEIESGQVYPG